VKQKDSGDKLIFGIFSGREVFYLLFGIFVIIVLVFYGWASGSDGDRPPDRDPQFANGRDAASMITVTGGIPISETELLYYNDRLPPTNAWTIYNASNDKITDGGRLAQPLFHVLDDYRDLWKSIRFGYLAGWNGNVVFAVYPTNTGSIIFEWKTNEQGIQVFKPADYSGGQRFLSSLAPGRIIPLDEGWLYSWGFYSWKRPILVTGGRFGPTAFAHPYPTNCILNSCFPFEGRIYVTGVDTNTSLISITIVSLTNQLTVFSNPAVKMPVGFDVCLAQPDPSGRRVVWTFEHDPKIAAKIYAALPRFLRPRSPPGPTVYYFVSDLRATKFHFICSFHNPSDYQFLWGVNGNSIWLPDRERGIKRYDLK
jgi:hypothetical protein